jgi:sterol desaturase/sphingolipid hydroxylase (fatty acid hydroxylase superfamily)
MSNFLLSHEPLVRLSVFIGVFALMAAWELHAPRRRRTFRRLQRWPGNLGVVALNTLAVRLVFPVAAMGVALTAETKDWGLFRAAGAPDWIAVIASVILLDLIIYLQHALTHAIPALWRLHRMHHADLEMDVTTGARFHPLEIILSMAIKLGAVAALGAPAAAVLIFETLLNATAMLNHSNIRLPERADRLLRWIVVTPDMHRVHHSATPRETNSNFGFNLPWWDRLLGTYRPEPAEGQEGVTIGLREFRDARELRLDRMLSQPFRGGAGAYPLGRREAAG